MRGAIHLGKEVCSRKIGRTGKVNSSCRSGDLLQRTADCGVSVQRLLYRLIYREFCRCPSITIAFQGHTDIAGHASGERQGQQPCREIENTVSCAEPLNQWQTGTLVALSRTSVAGNIQSFAETIEY